METGINIFGRIPIDPAIAKLVDEGKFEDFSCEYLFEAAEKLEQSC